MVSQVPVHHGGEWSAWQNRTAPIIAARERERERERGRGRERRNQ
jgi:hypothetical protein